MRTMAKVKKWGNSAAVRIPATILASAGLALEQPVDVHEEEGRIVIEAARRKRFRIGDLVKGIRPDNLHDAVDAGPPLGREVW
jgi:antitoxin MazE